VRASSNSPSVLTIFRFAAYLNQVQAPIVLFGLAPCGTDFHSVSGNLRFCHHGTLQIGFVSILLPVISDSLSPDHTACKGGEVSSDESAYRSPARTRQSRLPVNLCITNLAYVIILQNGLNVVF